jgi:phage terminase small subunit
MPKPPKGRKLTPKQRKFVDEYLVDLNVTAAARRAGYSPKTAHVIGHETLKKPNVADYLAKRREEIGSVGITPERVLEEYAKLALLDPDDLVDKNGNLLPIPQIPAHARAAIGGIEQETIKIGKKGVKVKRKYRIIDKKGSLDSIARTLGMFEKDNAQRDRDRPVNVNVNFRKADIESKFDGDG